MKSKYRKAVFVIVYRIEKNNIKYLLLKRKLHWKGWEFPKGGIKDKESLLKTVKREIKEETSQDTFNIKDYKLSGKYKYNKIYPDRPGIIGQTYKLFSAEIKNKKVKISKKEHSSYVWKDYKNTLKLLTWSNQRKCLKYVNKRLEELYNSPKRK